MAYEVKNEMYDLCGWKFMAFTFYAWKFMAFTFLWLKAYAFLTTDKCFAQVTQADYPPLLI